MLIGVYPGSFDPITLGHYDIIKRGAKFVDKLIVGVLHNSEKNPMFSVEERVKMIKEVVKDLPNVEVQQFGGLLVDFMSEHNAQIVIRGLRAVSDFEYELQMAQTNHKLKEDIETVFLATNVQYSYVSSSLVKEIAKYNGNIEDFVPHTVLKYVKEKNKGDTYEAY